jgi:hypothetical protein
VGYLYAEAIYWYKNKERCVEWHLQRSNSSVGKREDEPEFLFQLFCKFHSKKMCMFPGGEKIGQDLKNNIAFRAGWRVHASAVNAMNSVAVQHD